MQKDFVFVVWAPAHGLGWWSSQVSLSGGPDSLKTGMHLGFHVVDLALLLGEYEVD